MLGDQPFDLRTHRAIADEDKLKVFAARMELRRGFHKQLLALLLGESTDTHKFARRWVDLCGRCREEGCVDAAVHDPHLRPMLEGAPAEQLAAAILADG